MTSRDETRFFPQVFLFLVFPSCTKQYALINYKDGIEQIANDACNAIGSVLNPISPSETTSWLESCIIVNARSACTNAAPTS